MWGGGEEAGEFGGVEEIGVIERMERKIGAHG